jgi:hypothetical protein
MSPLGCRPTAFVAQPGMGTASCKKVVQWQLCTSTVISDIFEQSTTDIQKILTKS